MKKSQLVPLSDEEIEEISAALWTALDEGQYQDLNVLDALVWRFQKLTEKEKDEKTNTLGGDDCFTGRMWQSKSDPNNVARIVVALPYGEHQFIAYDSDNNSE